MQSVALADKLAVSANGYHPLGLAPSPEIERSSMIELAGGREEAGDAVLD